MNKLSFGVFPVRALLVATAIGLAACSSPTEKAEEFYEKGAELLKKGDLDKANIEFRNALQIKKDMAPALYGMTQIAEAKGNWQELFNLLTRVTEIDPNHLEAQIKLGRMLLAANELDRALKVSDKTLELAKDDPNVLSLRAAMLYRLDDRKGAIEQANAALAKDANNIDALVVLATERLSAGDANKAIEYLDKGINLNEKNSALQLIKIQALEKLARSDDAEAILRKLIGFYPQSRAYRHILARFYLAHGQRDKAEAEYRAIVTENPKDAKAKMELVDFVGRLKGIKAATQELQGFVQQDESNNTLKFALVDLLRAQKDDKGARDVLQAVSAKEGDAPDGLKAKGLLATILLGSGDMKAAKALIDEILAKDQRNEQAVVLKAGMDLDARKIDETIANLRNLLRDVPNSVQGLLMLGKAHELAGSPQLAEEHYQKAYKASKQTPAVAVSFAEYLLKRGEADRAGQLLNEALAKSPGNVGAMKLLAQARIAKGDWTGAQELADAVRKQNDEKKVADQIQGAIFAGKKNYEASIDSFRRFYEASPNEMQPVVALVQAYLMAGKNNEALAFVESVLKATPSNTGARLMQAQLLERKGDAAGAAQAYQTVMASDPKNVASYRGMVGLHLRAGQLAEADKALAQGLAAVPGDFNLRAIQASVHEQAGRFDQAIASYEELLKARPDADVLANNLASLLTDHRSDKASLDRAYTLAQRLKRGEIPQFKDTAGWASYKAGRNGEALTLLKEAVKMLPEDAVFRYHLGMAYLAQGDKTSARKELGKAVELAARSPFPQLEEAKKALQGL